MAATELREFHRRCILYANQLQYGLYKHIMWILTRSWGEAGCQGKTEDNKTSLDLFL